MNLHFFPFFFLALGMVFLWIPSLQKGWFVPFLIAVLLAITGGSLGVFGLAVLALLFLACYFSYHQEKSHLPKFFADGCIVVLGVFLMLRTSFGFNDWQVIAPYQCSLGSLPFSFHLKFGKGSLGLLLLAFSPGILSYKRKEWLTALQAGITCTLIAIVLLLLSSLALQYVGWDFKLPPFWRIWMFYNLFFVSIPEEAFFRGFLLSKIAFHCRKWKWGNLIALIVSSALFGAGHFYGGISFVILSTIAGILYGVAYLWSGKLEAAIFTHFMVNTIHFLAFTYPCLVGM